jgi:hypothetical protein
MRRRHQRGVKEMAETKDGNKFVVVPSYKRTQDGKTVTVHKHDRSTPTNSKGKAKGS